LPEAHERPVPMAPPIGDHLIMTVAEFASQVRFFRRYLVYRFRRVWTRRPR